MHKQDNSEQKLEISGEKADRKWKGIGLFVKENCKERDLIIEYVGKVVQKLNKSNCNVYYMTLFDKQLWINSANVGGLAMFINHSCDPDCKLD